MIEDKINYAIMRIWSAIKNWYRLNVKVPGPTELGHTTFSALQSRRISKFIPASDYTWEDWEREVKIRFPIRYFLSETIPDKFNSAYAPLKRRVGNFIYFFQCHLFKEYKFHIIDIRQEKGFHYKYSWGYLDPSEQILLANFSILKDFIDNNGIVNILDSISLEELTAQGLGHQHEIYLEAMEIYKWWTVERGITMQANEKMLDEYLNEEDEKIYRARQQAFHKAEQDFEEKDDEMLCRLIKIRRHLWY